MQAKKEKELAVVEDQNIFLHQRVEEISDAKDKLEKDYHSMVVRLKTLDKMKEQVEAFRSQASNVKANLSENYKRIEELQTELHVCEQQVCFTTLCIGVYCLT